MKKLLLSTAIALSLSVNAQDKDKDNYFYPSFGFDIKNAWQGSKPTNNERALNWIAGANVVSDNIDFGIGYERFKELNYSRKFMSVGYHLKVGYITGTDMKLSINPALEWSCIRRTFDNETRDFSTPSLNLAFQLDLTKNLSVQLVSNLLPRPDIRRIYGTNKTVLSNGFKILYKFNLN